ncbi:unnamed protein product [Fraxinus pennsylvanica]|uniref:Uncharacterized protein n=1 Tax=Fraxinus pennsylvanica TaxID=56036 RepID=A0AAD1ZIC5_9LAMI|nr:unnamed protein product [Fraxinus pennsylvanica]
MGYEGIEVTVSEMGWLSKDDSDETGATAENLAIYNQNLFRWQLEKGYHNNPTSHGCSEHPSGPPRLLHKTSDYVIRHCQDGDGFLFVDVNGESTFGQKIVKVAKFRVSSKEHGDVEGCGGRDKDEEVEKY